MQLKRNVLAAMILLGLSGMAFAQQSVIANNTKAAHPLVYSHEEMFQFDIETYLQGRAPHLLPYAETISHWAGYTSVSPKVLIALMEQQSGVISKGQGLAASAINRPFGDLSRAQGFGEQVRDVADQLANLMYAPPKHADAAEFASSSAQSPLQALFAANAASNAPAAVAEKGVNDFAQTYLRLFGKTFDQAGLKQAPSLAPQQQDASLLAGPANGFLQFPFPTGATWYVGGAHTTTGSGNYPLSSLDMSLGGGWGSNQSNVWATSSAAGTFKKHSSCFAEIVHSGGWSTTYYHLMNIQYNTGAAVSKNVKIANPANTMAQALCNGGHSTGPHEHWSLKLNGAYYHLNGVSLSGWTITATGSSYDTNCTRFNFTKNGTKKCAGSIKN